MSRRVLITGSAGFIGSHCVDFFIQNTDWKIIGIDSFRHRGDSLRVAYTPDRYEIITHDLSAPISEMLARKIGPVDYILNVASESHVDRSIEDPIPFVENNVKLALNILEFARRVRPTAFIQCSTDEVFGPAFGNSKHGEWCVNIPSNPYAASKASQDALCIAYWRTYSVPVIITNCMNLFGERQHPEKYISMLISKIQLGESIVVHGSLDYIGQRMYLHASNLPHAWHFLLTNTVPSQYEDGTVLQLPDRYNIVGVEEVNNLDLAERVARILNRPLRYELLDFHSARPGHDRRYALDGAKIASLGWKPLIQFQPALEQTCRWFLEHPEWTTC